MKEKLELDRESLAKLMAQHGDVMHLVINKFINADPLTAEGQGAIIAAQLLTRPLAHNAIETTNQAPALHVVS